MECGPVQAAIVLRLRIQPHSRNEPVVPKLDVLDVAVAHRKVARGRCETFTIETIPEKIRLLPEGLMRSSSVSMLRGATWLYVGSLVAIAGFALFSLCYNLFSVALNLASSVVGQLAR